MLSLKDSLLIVAETGLWQSDGTTSGTRLVKNMKVNVSSDYPDDYLQIQGVNDRCIFSGGESPGIFDFWVTDGATTGTLCIGPTGLTSNAPPHRLVQCGDSLFYTGLENSTGVELWTVPLAPFYSAATAWFHYR